MYNDWLKFREVKEAFPIGTIVEYIGEGDEFKGKYGKVDRYSFHGVSGYTFSFIGMIVKFDDLSEFFFSHYSNWIPAN